MSANHGTHYEQYRNKWNEKLIKRLIYEMSTRKLDEIKILGLGYACSNTIIAMLEMSTFSGCEFFGYDLNLPSEYQTNKTENFINAPSQESELFNNASQKTQSIPFSSQSMHCVIGRSILKNEGRQDPITLFKEIFRILKSNGVAIFHELCIDQCEENLQHLNEQRRKAGVDVIDFNKLYTIDQIKETLNEAGLQNNYVIYQGQGLNSVGIEIMINR